MKKSISLLLLIVVLCVGAFISALPVYNATQKSEALEFHTFAVDKIEESGLNIDIIEECKKEANDKGYILEVEKVDTKDESSLYIVTLKYDIKIPVFNMKKENTVTSYAK